MLCCWPSNNEQTDGDDHVAFHNAVPLAFQHRCYCKAHSKRWEAAAVERERVRDKSQNTSHTQVDEMELDHHNTLDELDSMAESSLDYIGHGAVFEDDSHHSLEYLEALKVEEAVTEIVRGDIRHYHVL